MRKPLMHPRSKILHWIYKLNLMPKLKFFLWLVIRNALPTHEFLIARRMEISNMCCLCNQIWIILKVFFKNCTFVQSIWDHIKFNCPTPLLFEGDFLFWIETVYKNYKINWKICNRPMEKFAIILWNVWIHRNQIVFKKIQPNPFFVIEKATFNFQNL